jgi:VIT1/CCC1 family predicted Fe2+/Mn2+ transporter
VRRSSRQTEVHLSQRSNWLRAAVLGANDGILSTASLVLGVAASGASGSAIVTAGVAGLYEQRGLPPRLATEVAVELSRSGALAAHARDELGLDQDRLARPLQAAWTSALSFASGAALPLVAVAVTPAGARVPVAVAVTLIALAVLGDLGARLGGAPRRPATVRVVVWGTVAMAITSGIGALVGTVA